MTTPTVKLHDKFPQVIEYEDINLCKLQYLVKDGILVPGHVWIANSWDHYVVTFFLPMGPHEMPEVLGVEQMSP